MKDESLIFILLGLLSIIAFGLVFLLSLRKRLRSRNLKTLIGALGLVHTTLSPEGTVLIGGEIWRARSNDASSIAVQSKVVVIAMHEHMVIVSKIRLRSGPKSQVASLRCTP